MCLHGTGETVRARNGLSDSAPAGPPPPPPGPLPWPRAFHRVADLSHVISPTMAGWDDVKPVRETVSEAAPEGEFGLYVQQWTFGEHTGTHLDAPGHVIGGGRLVPDIRPEELVAPAAVIDVRARAAEDPDTTVTVDDVLAFERAHGEIPAGAAVLMNSGWSARWARGDEAVRGVAADGSWHFPGFGAEACEFLVARRRVAGVGVDTLSTDPGRSTDFAAHEVLGRADRWGLESLTGLDRLPPTGALLSIGVMPGLDASGGPSRVLALW
ncbi:MULTISPECIES: cyclase family protein [Nocardiopsidaceae]|uniref:Cyclase family protein n=2 Tax=Nocardiopsidaceae TaxID=83676 RepID=A0ABY6YSF5_9ACTN|nr:cyclase family protein [Streptomonospora nanhaiensis]WAE75308.1 cyclase family protein [Streptomonospora nanhaiensis]